MVFRTSILVHLTGYGGCDEGGTVILQAFLAVSIFATSVPVFSVSRSRKVTDTAP